MDTVDALLERARRKAGLENFGQESFREGLERLIHSITTEGRLTKTGETVFEKSVLDLLRQRLEIEDWFARHPEIDAQEIAELILYLSSDRAGWMTGETIAIDGGRHLTCAR